MIYFLNRILQISTALQIKLKKLLEIEEAIAIKTFMIRDVIMSDMQM